MGWGYKRCDAGAVQRRTPAHGTEHVAAAATFPQRLQAQAQVSSTPRPDSSGTLSRHHAPRR